MIRYLDVFRGLDAVSVFLRLFLAMLFGGLIGMERGRKHRPAGFRTYMIVCMGAALTMILGEYEAFMFSGPWYMTVEAQGLQTDVSRFSAQVINGVGFLGAGTILVTGRQQAKGLTTAAALWASACIGLAIGAGFYECIIWGFLLIFICVRILPGLENRVVENARNMNVYIEFDSVNGIDEILQCMRGMNIHVYDIDIEREKEVQLPSLHAVFSLRLSQKYPHARILAELSKVESIQLIEEI